VAEFLTKLLLITFLSTCIPGEFTSLIISAWRKKYNVFVSELIREPICELHSTLTDGVL
jgi:hypothetical protein